MAEEWTGAAPEEESGSWRRGWAGAAAIVATLLLVGLIVMVILSNRARDAALAAERHTYDVMLLTRTVDATIARSEAALGRYVLDEKPESGNLYYSEWVRAGRQIGQLKQLLAGDPAQQARADRLDAIYDGRGRELAVAGQHAAAHKSSGGVPFFYQAGLSPSGPALRATLDIIAAGEQSNLKRRMAETRMFDAEADTLTQWLSWAGVAIGLGAILLAWLAWRAIAERSIANAEAESEATRAMALDTAVQARTRELRDANERLQAEAAERAAAEAQLRQVQKMEAVGRLTGGIAHDFNNMLAVIVGGLDLARRKLRGPKREVEFHLDNAMEGATRAAALTRRLLAFARSEPLLPQAVAPAELIESMLDLIDRSMGERIAVETDIADEPWHVWVDTNQLENAILNLCVNARDAMDGEGRVEVAVANLVLGDGEIGQLGAGDYVRISVGDSGEGIAPEHIERVFEPFFTTKPVGKGTGLGLSQIFGFARESAGDIVIDSTLGEGTRVAIYLPRSIEAAAAAAGRMPASGPQVTPAAASAGIEVLVVEDDPRVSRATVGALEELGYLPLACGGGREALDILARDDRVGLIVTDVMMPEMTGPELARIVGDRHPHIAILFVTGFVGETNESGELAGHPIVRKPFTVSALADAVAAALADGLSGSRRAATSEAAE